MRQLHAPYDLSFTGPLKHPKPPPDTTNYSKTTQNHTPKRILNFLSHKSNSWKSKINKCIIVYF